ncbi:hypothetical protein OEZ66_26195, partial [Escherichia coli]|nr:hypothetical protein [Escherichia coli]
MGHGTCKAAKSARHLIESKEKNRSSRVKVFSTRINLSHPAASWQATQTCANNIFNLFQNNNALYLFENDNKIELRMGYDSFFSIETIDKIHKENIKEIKLINETTYVSLPNPTILITTTSTPERQFSISVLDDGNKENLPTDTAPCF